MPNVSAVAEVPTSTSSEARAIHATIDAWRTLREARAAYANALRETREVNAQNMSDRELGLLLNESRMPTDVATWLQFEAARRLLRK